MSSPEFLPQVRPADVLREAILRHVRYTLVRPTSELKAADYLKPVSLAIRDRIVDRMLETESPLSPQGLEAPLLPLHGIPDGALAGRHPVKPASERTVPARCWPSFGVSLDEVLESEPDAGLGNGGLGRLAACFLESLATLDMPGFGYGIDYEYGLFRQEIVNGFQREKPDRWKANGTPFQIAASRRGHRHSALRARWKCRATAAAQRQSWLDLTRSSSAYRTTCRSSGTTARRSTACGSVHGPRLGRFRHRDLQPRRLHPRRRAEDRQSENISRVLYPSDSVDGGQGAAPGAGVLPGGLRVRDIMRALPASSTTSFELFPTKVAIQMNDTHPALAVAELMRDAGRRTRPAVGAGMGDHAADARLHQPHAAARGAGEVVACALLERVLPRHMQIIFDINHRLPARR